MSVVIKTEILSIDTTVCTNDNRNNRDGRTLVIVRIDAWRKMAAPHISGCCPGRNGGMEVVPGFCGMTLLPVASTASNGYMDSKS